MKLIQPRLAKICSIAIDMRIKNHHKKYLRLLKTGKEAMLALPVLTVCLVQFAYRDDLDLCGKLWTSNLIVAVVGVRIISDTEQSKDKSSKELLSLLQKRAKAIEYDLTYGVIDK
jgi:hypothetical protein